MRPDDHAAVLRVWSKRHRDLSQSRNPGRMPAARSGVRPDPRQVSTWISAAGAAWVLDRAEPSGAVQQARRGPPTEFLADLRRIDAEPRGTRKKLVTAVRTSGTS